MNEMSWENDILAEISYVGDAKVMESDTERENEKVVVRVSVVVPVSEMSYVALRVAVMVSSMVIEVDVVSVTCGVKVRDSLDVPEGVRDRESDHDGDSVSDGDFVAEMSGVTDLLELKVGVTWDRVRVALDVAVTSSVAEYVCDGVPGENDTELDTVLLMSPVTEKDEDSVKVSVLLSDRETVAENETSDVADRVGDIVSCCEGVRDELIVSLLVSVLELLRVTSDENDTEAVFEGERESEMSSEIVGLPVFV